MAEHKAQIIWERGQQSFLDNKYSRAHQWKLDGGLEIPASSSPSVIPPPLSDPAAIDPEEAFVASLASCHMLWFLAIAGKKKFTIDKYTDDAYGTMKKNESGYFYIDKVFLRPKVIFSGEKMPTEEEQMLMHEEAHKQCFIANSVKSEVECKPNFN